MGKKMKISAVILVGGKLDNDLFKKTKSSLSWVNEIVEIKTKRIPGSFAAWRNEGIKRSLGEWILYVDTDEQVSKKLHSEIVKLLKKNKVKHTAYAIPRRNFIFGKEFKHGGQRPDYQKRLFKKSALHKWVGELHEEPAFDGSLGHLKNPLIHHKHKNLFEMVEKTNEWSEIEAKLMLKAAHPKMNVFRFASAAFREFWLRFVVQLCFLDGVKGVIYGSYQVYSRLISYSKLWEKQLSTIRT